MSKLILASSSPRRKDLLAQIGVYPDVIDSPEVDESVAKGENHKEYALRMAKEKAYRIYGQYKGDFILAADTVVVCRRKILSKAFDNACVSNYLRTLSGRRHEVLTAVVVIAPCGKIVKKVVSAKVKFKSLCEFEIEQYLESGEGTGKAGGYAIQGLAASFVKNINGSYSAIVGLPLYETNNLLTGLGYTKREFNEQDK